MLVVVRVVWKDVLVQVEVWVVWKDTLVRVEVHRVRSFLGFDDLFVRIVAYFASS